MCLSCTIEHVTGFDLSTNEGHDALDALERIPWPDATPAMIECAAYVAALYQHPDGGTGGPLHVVVDDDNIEDSSLAFCRARIAAWEAYDTESTTETVNRARMLSTWILDLFDTMTEKERAVTLALSRNDLSVIAQYNRDGGKILRVWMPESEFTIREDMFDEDGNVIGFQWGFKQRVHGDVPPAVDNPQRMR